MKRAPHRLVESYEKQLQPAEVAFHRAYWDSQVEATPVNEQKRSELELEVRRLKGDSSVLDEVTAALEEAIHEPILKRQLEVMRLSLTANQMDEERRTQIVELSSAVESEFASFRVEIDGGRLTENEVNEILKTSADVEERRRVYLGSKAVGRKMGSRIRELARLRNSVALEMGFSDFYRMGLELQEISEDWLFGLFDELESLTATPFRTWKDGLDERLKKRFGTDDLMPWHYGDPFFQNLPPDGGIDIDGFFKGKDASELAKATFAAWGIDVSGVLQRSDLYPREMKSQHAFCLDIDRTGKDVRILGNIVEGERWTEVILHESGHAAYDVSIDPHLPYLLRRAAHTFVTEAIAILSGRLVRDPEWLATLGGVDKTEVAPIEDELRRASAIQSLLFARWVLVMTHFERELYSDPEADLDATWWEFVERFQFLTPPDEGAEGAWASKIHIAAAPVYYHNYLLGELLASQLETTAQRRFGKLVGASEVGDWLKREMFSKGSSMRWDRLIESVIDGPLTAVDFAVQVTSGSAPA
ncbi:MAG: peptidyl-dipeptidase [Actinomycetota bacterium]|jgi:peptidyl-dipeptidase A|nr:peptidyl-dipeptidase [Actinomycetota bacterium]